MSDDMQDLIEMMGWNNPSMVIQPPTEQTVLTEKGLVKVEKAPWIKLNVNFRTVMKKLKGAKLAVFLNIALHVGRTGTAFPSIDTIADETGYCSDVVRDTIKELREMGMLNVQSRDGRSNIYTPSMFFAYGRGQEPWDEEAGEPMGEKPPLGESSTPPLEETSTPPWIKVLPEEEPVSKNIEPLAPAGADPQEKQPFDVGAYKSRIEKAVSTFYANNAGKVDVSSYPEDAQQTIREFAALWHMDVPRKSRSKSGEFADWISGAREINDACAEFGLDLLRLYAEEYEKEKAKKNGVSPYRVTRPASIVKSLRGLAAEVRSNGLAVGGEPKTIVLE